MNAERLLQHYERIADAPDAIARLRRFILDLAVRGKLVPQDSKDEPASELLKRIAKEKARLVKAGELRKPRDLEGGNELNELFPIPATWKWVRLDAVGAIIGGGTPSAADPDNFTDPGQGVPWLTPADLGGYSDLYISRGSRDLSEKGSRSSSATVMPKGTVLFTSRAPIGYVAIAANPVSTNQGFKSIVPYIPDCSRFIATAMKAFAAEIDAKASGTTFKEVSGKIVAAVPFPLPPLAEQHRIVAKVDELMGLCDRLEAARAGREAVRDRLAAASLARLNAPDSETFQADARFALDALPALTTRPDQIKALRQTILNLAVRGKLVQQDPNDEPASELLKRIARKRAALLKAGYPNPEEARAQLKKLAEQLVPDGLDALPFGWSWATLLQCSALVIDCKNKTAPYASSGIRLIRTTNVRDGQMNLNDQKYVDQKTYEVWSARCTPEPGDILITREAPMGEVCLIPPGETICLGQRMMLARLVPETIDRHFMIYSLRDPRLMDRVQDKPIGATVQHLRVGGVETLLVPLPPLAEQRRIVAKVDALMVLCDRLEASLTITAATRRRLLDALLAEALAPADIAEMEAAE
ncbi:MAG: hypothetical protein RL519_531 [Pseudomonadota bacterium]|jgi:type I restriction enzyme S subunit